MHMPVSSKFEYMQLCSNRRYNPVLDLHDTCIRHKRGYMVSVPSYVSWAYVILGSHQAQKVARR